MSMMNVDERVLGDHAQVFENSMLLTLSLDQISSSGFQSINEYLFAKIDMRIKLVPGNSAGNVTTFFVITLNLFACIIFKLFSFCIIYIYIYIYMIVFSYVFLIMMVHSPSQRQYHDEIDWVLRQPKWWSLYIAYKYLLSRTRK